MNRRIWTGVAAGVLAAAVLLSVGIGAYRAGQRDDEVVTRTVENGEVVRVVDRDWGPGPGFFLFPLLVIGGIVLLARGRRWGHGGWHGPYGHGYGYGPYGPGRHGPDEALDEWHRRAHGEEPEAASPPDRE